MITQTEVNAAFDEQVSLCTDTLQKKTKEYTRDDTDWLGHLRLLLFCSAQRPGGHLCSDFMCGSSLCALVFIPIHGLCAKMERIKSYPGCL